MDLRSAVIDLLMPHSLAAWQRLSRPPPPEDEQRRLVQEAVNEVASKVGSSYVSPIVHLVAAMTGRLEFADMKPAGGDGGLVYVPTTVFVVTYKHYDFVKNQLALVQHGEHHHALSEAGVLQEYVTKHTRPASEIEIAAFYGGLTAQAVRYIINDPHFAHIIEPLFDPNVEVVEEESDAIIPPPDAELQAIVAKAMAPPPTDGPTF